MPPVPLKYTLSASMLMVGDLQSSTQIVRKMRFFRCAHVTGGGKDLKNMKWIYKYQSIKLSQWNFIEFCKSSLNGKIIYGLNKGKVEEKSRWGKRYGKLRKMEDCRKQDWRSGKQLITTSPSPPPTKREKKKQKEHWQQVCFTFVYFNFVLYTMLYENINDQASSKSPT